MRLLNIGYGNFISVDRIIAMSAPDSAPIKRLIQDARDRGTLIDATCGKKTKSVIVMDSDHVILSADTTEKLGAKLTEIGDTEIKGG